jgi:hypothetical protein
MAKKRKPDDACPFPPGVDLPKKGGLTSYSRPLYTSPVFIGVSLLLASALFIYGLSLAPPPIIKLQANPSIWNETLPTSEEQTYFGKTGPWKPRYQNVTTQKGYLILQGDQVLKIENCSYAFNGTVLVKDHAKIIIQNADIFLKHKNGWNGDDPIPTGLNIKFQDQAEFQAMNSTIYTTEDTAEVGFQNETRCRISYSNMSRVDFTGVGEATLKLDDSQVNLFYIGENAVATLTRCRVFNLFPALFDYDSLKLDTDKARVEAYDSSIVEFTTYYVNSTVSLSGPIGSLYENWNSLRDLTDGGSGFNVTLNRTTVSKLTIYCEDGKLTISGVNGLYRALNFGNHTRTTIVNSTIPYVSVGVGGGTLDGCRVYSVQFRGGGDWRISRSRLGYLFMDYWFGTLDLHQVKSDQISGYRMNCTLTGDFSIENGTVQGIWEDSRVTRIYPIQVMSGDRAAPGVDLRLVNATGGLVWTGKTDGSGRANLSVTFYQNLRYINGVNGSTLKDLSKDVPKFSDELKLTASSYSVEKEAPLRLTSGSPVLIAFPVEPEVPVYAQGWFLQVIAAALALTVTALYILKRNRR